MPQVLKNCKNMLYLVFLLGLFVQSSAQETGTDKTVNYSNEQLKKLIEKASTNSKDFSDEEVRELISIGCSGHVSDWTSITRKKLIDLGESIYPFLCEEAMKVCEENWNGLKVANIIGLFDKSEGDKTEARKTTLYVLERFPDEYSTVCRVMGNIGEPEDVPKLLSLISDDPYVCYGIIKTVDKIASVSQIPEIEKAYADWEKRNPADNAEWKKNRKATIDECITNICERDTQLPSAPDTPPATKGSILIPVLITLGILVLIGASVYWFLRSKSG